MIISNYVSEKLPMLWDVADGRPVFQAVKNDKENDWTLTFENLKSKWWRFGSIILSLLKKKI